MGQALYRKYRSKTLDEVVGQEHVTQTISNALQSGSISHAYLFTGPRGVGKTSVARILAHEINQLAYDESKSYMDIIEIDAASNRRIDEIRDLRDKVHIAPTSAKYKVYIIDEVHMLTKESFNALLKTLEEPPSHVIFILATTEAHKLPDTIISRTQHFNFKPIDEKLNAKHLLTIAEKENIEIDEYAAELIAKHGAGSFRDSISLLDQLSSVTKQKISIDDVRRALGIAPDDLITKILEAIDQGEVNELLTILSEARTSGFNSSQISYQLSAALRNQIAAENNYRPTSFKLMKDLLSIPASSEPDTLLEIVLLEASFAGLKPGEAKITKPTTPALDKPIASTMPTEIKKEPVVEAVKTPEAKVAVEQPSAEDKTTGDSWNKILDALKAQYNTLYSVVRMAQHEIKSDSVTLTFDFPFHYKRIEEPKNKAILENIVKTVLGKKYKLVCSLKSKPNIKPKTDQSDLKAISNIFGDVEVLES